MKRKLISIINVLILIIIAFLFVYFLKPKTQEKDESKVQVIATIFPNYDFAKKIGGEKAEITLLLSSGVESHTYEPSPKDMIEIEQSDIFIYTGNEFEPWAKNILDGISNNLEIVDTSKNIELINIEEFEEKNINSEIVQDEENEESHDESSFDSHIWLNPKNAIIMIDNCLSAFCRVDPQNSDYYKQNAENYKKEILELDLEFENLIKNSKRNELAFAGEFAYTYFIDRYNLKFISVYNNCGEGQEPSIAKIKSIIDYINNHNMPVVFYEELSEGNVARMIGSETKAKSLIFYSLHNGDIKKDSYITLMKENYKVLEEALK